jgi:hypothetical protein
MKRTIVVIVLVIVAFAAIVLARLPASWVLPTASADFSCASVAGSLWNGYCGGLTVRGAALGDLTWQLRPVRLLSGELAAHIDLEHPPSLFARGEVGIGLGGTLAAHDLTASLPLSPTVIPGLPPALTGSLRLNIALAQLTRQGSSASSKAASRLTISSTPAATSRPSAISP